MLCQSHGRGIKYNVSFKLDHGVLLHKIYILILSAVAALASAVPNFAAANAASFPDLSAAAALAAAAPDFSTAADIGAAVP